MNTRKPVVLLAPLDWGLGHTVRCIPIIQELLKQKCDVLVACNSKQKQFLYRENASITFIHLEGYNIKYGKSRLQTLFKIFLQTPKMLIKVNRERTWLKKFLLQTRVDAVISDNRYGFVSSELPSIFITHQLRPISGTGPLVDGFIQKVLYYYINKFGVCWIPDWISTEINAGGKLSHPEKLPGVPIKYIGCLSRFEKSVSSPGFGMNTLLIILSGPEPQRTVLENLIVGQLKTGTLNAVLVRGVFDNSSIASSDNIIVLNNASSIELNALICNSDIIVGRSGYTTVMDILKLGKKSILIPTPGQAEQEYLATYLHEKKFIYAMDQKTFCLKTALEKIKVFPFQNITTSMEQYKPIIETFVASLKDHPSNLHA